MALWYSFSKSEKGRKRECSKGSRADGAAWGTWQQGHNATFQALARPAGPWKRPHPARQSPGCRDASRALPSPARPLVTAHATGYPCKCELHGCARLATPRACTLEDRAFFTRATTRANFTSFLCIIGHFTGISPPFAGKKKRLANYCLRAV